MNEYSKYEIWKLSEIHNDLQFTNKKTDFVT